MTLLAEALHFFMQPASRGHFSLIAALTTACLFSALATDPPADTDSLDSTITKKSEKRGVGPGYAKRNYPTSATLKQCPDGHMTLKDVPIVYGLPPFKGSAAKRWQESIKNYEMWSAGCVSTPDSPTIRPTCTTCGFGYDSESENWSRASADIATFKRPFSPLIASFPKPTAKHQKDALRFYQSIRTNQVTYQSVSYTSSEPRDALVACIHTWFKTNNITPTYTETNHKVTFDGEKLISEWGSQSASVMLQHVKKNRSSWVMLSVLSR